MLLVCEELILKLTFSLCCNENVCRYMYGMSANNMGLQMLLEKVPRSRKWRCLRSTQVWNRSKSFQPKSFSWHSRFPNHISISYWWIAFRKVCVCVFLQLELGFLFLGCREKCLSFAVFLFILFSLQCFNCLYKNKGVEEWFITQRLYNIFYDL